MSNILWEKEFIKITHLEKEEMIGIELLDSEQKTIDSMVITEMKFGELQRACKSLPLFGAIPSKSEGRLQSFEEEDE